MSPTAAALSVVLLLAAAAADLALTPPYVDRVRAAVAAGDAGARTRAYRLTAALAWTAAVVAAGLLLAGGVGAAEAGLRLPEPGSLQRWSGALAGVAVGLVGSTVLARRGVALPVAGDVDVLVPRTSRERRWFAVVALTAGVTEEVVYRALALTALLVLLPGGAPVAVGVAAVLFGLGHAYQGRAGVLVTAVLAVALGALYLDTRSLLPGVVAHALLDLRVLLLPAAAAPDGAPAD